MSDTASLPGGYEPAQPGPYSAPAPPPYPPAPDSQLWVQPQGAGAPVAEAPVPEFLSKDAIFDVDDIETEDVYVPQWKGWVRVQALTGRERDRFEAELAGFARGGSGKKKNFDNFRARLVVASAIDETGHLMFAQGDVVKLGQKSSAALSVLAEVAQRLSGLTDEDAEELAGE